jgi:hypothetical protein
VAILISRVARADDKSACIAAFEDGQALVAGGHLTGAIPRFAVCGRDVCPPSLQRQCVAEGSETSARVPTVVLSATDDAHETMIDVRVAVDGAPFATVLDGKALPIDPGLHAFRFEATGFRASERQVAIQEGRKGQLVAVALARPSFVTTPSVEPAMATTKWLGVGLGSVGLVGIGVGAVYGLMAFRGWSEAKDQCSASCADGSAAYATKHQGEIDATVSTIAFAGGAALLVAGAILFVVSPSRASTRSAALALRPGVGSLAGTF